MYQIVDCSFKPDGTGRLYGYKVPVEWQPKPGEWLKVPDARGGDGAWKKVLIVRAGAKELPNIPYIWGLEIMTDEAMAEISANKVQTAMNPAPNETPNMAMVGNIGGALIGKALAADLAKPDPVSLQQVQDKPFTPAPPYPGAKADDGDAW